MTNKPETHYLNPKCAADYLSVSASTLKRLRVNGQGPCYAKAGGRVIYDSADLDAWVKTRKRNFTRQYDDP
ncbi:MAG: DNA-binding protein [Rhodospirillaceae bacterium]|nr:MAG: DNA-binding protein [Rhodospirillaceae bacterium]